MSLMKLMTSKNPDADIASWIALDDGYNPCNDLGDSTNSATETEAKCSLNFFPVFLYSNIVLYPDCFLKGIVNFSIQRISLMIVLV
jgi:hypothetical protein